MASATATSEHDAQANFSGSAYAVTQQPASNVMNQVSIVVDINCMGFNCKSKNLRILPFCTFPSYMDLNKHSVRVCVQLSFEGWKIIYAAV